MCIDSTGDTIVITVMENEATSTLSDIPTTVIDRDLVL